MTASCVPSCPICSKFDLISFAGNAVLQSIPNYQAGIGEGVSLAEGISDRTVNVVFSHLAYEVGDNAQLTSAVIPFGHFDVQQLIRARCG